MSISFIGATSANAATTSLPSGASVGDLVVVVAGRTNTAGPSLASGWPTNGTDGADLGVTSGGSGGTAHGQRAGWKILTAGDITAGNVGTWTNAAEIGCAVYRNASAVSANSATGANSATVTFPARSGLAAGSWQVALGTHRNSGTNTLATRTLSGYTNRSDGLTSANVGIWDSNAATSGIAQQTATVTTSSGNVGRTLGLTERERSGSGVADLELDATGVGLATRSGSGPAAVELGATGVGVTPPNPTTDNVGFVSLGPFRLSGTPGATSTGSGVAAVELDATGVGFSARSGSGLADIELDATGVGFAARSGSGLAEIELSGTGVGYVLRSGSGPAAVELGATGVGLAPADATFGFISLGPFRLAGTPSAIPTGSGIAAVELDATGVGFTARAGSGLADIELDATGVGFTARSGAGLAAVELDATGVGYVLRSGSGPAEIELDAIGEGSAGGSGAGLAAIELDADAAGYTLRSGSGLAAVELDATGAGYVLRSGSGPAVLVLDAIGAGFTPAISARPWVYYAEQWGQTMQYLRQSTASQEIPLGPFLDDTDYKTPRTGLTISAADIRVWKHGQTTEVAKNNGGATHMAAGRYVAVLDAIDSDTVGMLEINVAVAGALPYKTKFMVLEESVYDALFAAGSAGYNATAPDNAGIAAIQKSTALIPALL